MSVSLWRKIYSPMVLSLALRNLKVNKFRTILSMIGIVIGVFAICSMGMVSSGFVEEINSSLLDSSATLEISSIEEKIIDGEKVTGFNTKDIRNIESAVKSVTREYELIPLDSKYSSLVIGQERVTASFYGVESVDMPKLVGLESGTWAKGPTNVMVGGQFAEDYNLKLGSRLTFLGISGEKITCRVVGILGESDSAGLTISAESGIVGTPEWYAGVAGNNHGLFTDIVIKVSNPQLLSDMKKAIEKKMNGKEGKTADDTVMVVNSYEILNSLGSLLETTSLFTVAISAISLLVAAVAIMNVMLMSVKERTREVGILRSIGTLKNQILQMFLYEAGIIGFFGALVGVIFSLGVSALLFLLLKLDLSVMLYPSVLLYIPIGIAVGLIVCLVSGFYPAWRASNLNPVDAMGNE